jgi:hypothetical protein
VKKLVALCLLIAACTTTPKGPEQTVYAAHGSYAAGLSLLVQYKNLPSCLPDPAAPVICKSDGKLRELQVADDQAFEALMIAQIVVREGTGPQAEAAATAASQAIAEFRKVTSTVRVQ